MSEWYNKRDSKARWKEEKSTKMRYELSHPWHFTFENSDKEKYDAGYDMIDWSSSVCELCQSCMHETSACKKNDSKSVTVSST